MHQIEDDRSLKGNVASVESGLKVNAVVGKAISSRRTEIECSQEQLSEATGISIQRLRGIEMGRKRPTPGELLRIGMALDVTLTYFFDDL